MKTLELNELKHYLGTGLKYYVKGKKVEWELKIIDSAMSFGHITPAMFPLSALTEPVLEGGKVPIVELAKIGTQYSNFIILNGKCVIEDQNDMEFQFMSESFVFDHGEYEGFGFVSNQLALFEQLFQWHFWPFDQSLFESGVLIDKRTVK